MTVALTARQQEILQLIQEAIANTGAPPTRAEIARQLGFKSANAAEEHLQALARKGAIELLSGTSRGIRLKKSPAASFKQAVLPIVKGMSMRDVGILDGDLLAVRATKEARNGQIVVARLGEDVTVKRFMRNQHLIELHAENPDFSTIVVQPGEPFEIEGLAVGLIRKGIFA